MKKLKKYDFKHANSVRYPWDEWFDGEPREATRGEDYSCADSTFVTTLYGAARRRGLSCRTTRPKEGVVVFQCPIPEEGE